MTQKELASETLYF